MAKEKSKRAKKRAEHIPRGGTPSGRSANSATNWPFNVTTEYAWAEYFSPQLAAELARSPDDAPRE